MSKWVLVLLSVVSVCAFAKGGNTGGGGTFVETPHSKALIFWDLYLHQPTFSESKPGDQLSLQPRKLSPSQGNIGDWIDPRDMDSFGFLKSRLRKWIIRAPNLIKLIRRTGTGDMLSEAEICPGASLPGQYYSICYDPRLHFLIVGTPLYVQDFEEIEVPQTFDVSQVHAYPAAYFQESNEVILMNLALWNRAGIKSQAALLLHEKLRAIQPHFTMSNEQLQRIVYDIILRDPNDIDELDFDDTLFAENNAGGYTRVLPGLSIEMSYYNLESKLNCLWNPNSSECSRANSNSDLVAADREIEAAVQQGLLGRALSEPKLRTTGRFTQPLTYRGPPLTPAVGVILDGSNCQEVFNQHMVSPPMWSGAAGCSGGGLVSFNHVSLNVGFTSPATDEFNLQVTAALPNRNDGGSEFGIEAMGMKVDLHNSNSSLDITGDHTQWIGRDAKFNADLGSKHKFVLRLLFAKRRVELVLNDDGNFRTNPRLAIWNMPDYFPATVSKISWNVMLYSDVNVSAIEILAGASGRSEAPSDPFENWAEKNRTGENYISNPHENCRRGFHSIFADSKTGRQECESIRAYLPKRGEECAPKFLTLIASGRPVCQNSSTYPEYWPRDGELCAEGYTDVGLDKYDIYGPARKCVDLARIKRYVVHGKNVHCVPSYRETAGKSGSFDWVVCERP